MVTYLLIHVDVLGDGVVDTHHHLAVEAERLIVAREPEVEHFGLVLQVHSVVHVLRVEQVDDVGAVAQRADAANLHAWHARQGHDELAVELLPDVDGVGVGQLGVERLVHADRHPYLGAAATASGSG